MDYVSRDKRKTDSLANHSLVSRTRHREMLRVHWRILKASRLTQQARTSSSWRVVLFLARVSLLAFLVLLFCHLTFPARQPIWRPAARQTHNLRSDNQCVGLSNNSMWGNRYGGTPFIRQLFWLCTFCVDTRRLSRKWCLSIKLMLVSVKRPYIATLLCCLNHSRHWDVQSRVMSSRETIHVTWRCSGSLNNETRDYVLFWALWVQCNARHRFSPTDRVSRYGRYCKQCDMISPSSLPSLALLSHHLILTAKLPSELRCMKSTSQDRVFLPLQTCQEEFRVFQRLPNVAVSRVILI